MPRLSDDEIRRRLSGLKGWTSIKNSIEKEFVLKDFSEAIALIVKIGIAAEKLDHHPDLFLHSWNKVKVTLSTHSEGGITDNDFNLAKQIDELKT